MDLIIEMEKADGVQDFHLEVNSNNGVTMFEPCFLCNDRFIHNNYDNLDPQGTENVKDEDILQAFFGEFGLFEKPITQCCPSCKSLCKHLDQIKNSLSSLIDEISSLLRQNEDTSGYLRSKSQVLARLFKSEPSASSAYSPSISISQIENDLLRDDSNLILVSSISISSANQPNFSEAFEINVVDDQASSSFANGTKKSFARLESELPENTLSTLDDSLNGSKIDSFKQESADDNVNIDGNEYTFIEESGSTSSKNLNSEQPLPRVGKHLCSICDKSFKHPRDFENHMGYHRQDKPFICEICGAGYRQKRGLESHVALHRGEAPFKCHHCSKTFTQKSGLMRHLPLHSGETMRFQCDICGKGFLFHTSFAHHKKIHSGERKYACQFCNQSFLSSSHLKRHTKIHTHTGEKPYTCEICQKAFTTKANLKCHRRIHTGIPAHSCPHCNLGFDKKVKLMKHLTDIHPENSRNLDNIT